MKQKCIVLTCDRCCKTEFLKLLFPDTYSSTDEETYQEPESGWSSRYLCGEYVDLCPECSQVVSDFEQTFMNAYTNK